MPSITPKSWKLIGSRARISTCFTFVATLTLILGLASGDATAKVNQPKGWNVQYVDASCRVGTTAAGAENMAPYEVMMGYLAGNHQFFIFSIEQAQLKAGLKNKPLPANMEAWLSLDGRDFKSSLKNENGMLVMLIENNLQFQRALYNSKKIGIHFRTPGTKKSSLVELFLANMSGAVEWLDACNTKGVDALP